MSWIEAVEERRDYFGHLLPSVGRQSNRSYDEEDIGGTRLA